MTTSVDTRKLYRRADGSVWVGEHWVGRTPPEAVSVAPLPTSDDPRWRPGKPSLLDTPVLTLSPFYPSGRLGVEMECKSSTPLGQYPNHPPFEGARAWMPLDVIEWAPVATLQVSVAEPKAVPSRRRTP